MWYYYITMNKKNLKYVFVILLAGIIAFLAAGVTSLIREENYVKNGVKVDDAVIKEIKRDVSSDEDNVIYNVFVEFKVNNVKHTGKLDFYESGMKEGAKITLYYMPDNPDDFSYGKVNYTFPIICFSCVGVFGVFALGIAVFAIARAVYKGRKSKKTLVAAKIESFSVTDKDGKFSVKLVCIDDVGNVYKSKFVSEDSPQFIKGETVNVFLSAADTDDYEIDTKGYLAKKAAESVKDAE